MLSYTTQQIAQRVRGELAGSADLPITGMASLERATDRQLSFVRESRHARRWSESAAAAVLAAPGLDLAPLPGRAVIAVKDVDLAVASVLELFAPPLPAAPVGVHPTAVVDPTAQLGPDVSVGPMVYIGPGVHIGEGSVLYARVCVMDEARIGRNALLYPGVVIGERCELGDRVILQNNVSIGADGFNYRPSADGRGLQKIPQIGNVRIGHDVEIGAGTCIDRAKFDATEIGDGSKIDNLVQIGHNCRIGRCCVIAGATALAGSVQVGDGVMMGGGCLIRDNIVIGAGARLAGGAGVTHNIPAGETVLGIPAREISVALREYAAIRKLPRLLTRWRDQFPHESPGT
jgi:UDP-3-O-[3-hydroxymyristoyl] glucosamine N-acyltransferase